ncbi:hypothetical protein HDU87_002455 [Geranomyces variabilis]|uniref:MAGE domain-containing protein n=1 Tax=Geranomyces variabilis TaxID=109894 RepID=A0AAD5TLF2_9FUNG|nr:hypothetical protein HDU87_002455 [Geranomyces variabilis]
MSQRRKSGRRQPAVEEVVDEPVAQGEEEYEDEVDVAAESQALAGSTNMTTEEFERRVKDVVRLALASEHRRQPLKRDEINKKVLKDNTRAFAKVFEGAQKRLQTTFGMEMVEMATREKRQPANVAGRRAAATAAPKQGSRSYILRSTLSPDDREAAINWGESEPPMVLLCIILGIIHVSGRKIEEGFLLGHLKRLGLRRGGPRHEKFPPIDDVLADFVKHAYLDRVKIATAEEDTYEYSWGPRAKIELKEEDLLVFITEVYPDLTPDAERRLKKDIIRMAGPGEFVPPPPVNSEA